MLTSLLQTQAYSAYLHQGRKTTKGTIQQTFYHHVIQDKTRQDNTRQDKTRQNKTRQDKTRQDKTRHTKQDYARQDMKEGRSHVKGDHSEENLLQKRFCAIEPARHRASLVILRIGDAHEVRVQDEGRQGTHYDDGKRQTSKYLDTRERSP